MGIGDDEGLDEVDDLPPFAAVRQLEVLGYKVERIPSVPSAAFRYASAHLGFHLHRMIKIGLRTDDDDEGTVDDDDDDPLPFAAGRQLKGWAQGGEVSVSPFAALRYASAHLEPHLAG